MISHRLDRAERCLLEAHRARALIGEQRSWRQPSRAGIGFGLAPWWLAFRAGHHFRSGS
jgi:hypothetical protein